MKVVLPALFFVAVAFVSTAYGGVPEAMAAQQLFLLNMLKLKGDINPSLEVQRKMLEQTVRGKRQVTKPDQSATTDETLPRCTTRPVFPVEKSGSDPALSAKERVVIKMLDRPYKVCGEGNGKLIWLPAPPKAPSGTREGINIGNQMGEDDEEQEGQSKSKGNAAATKTNRE